MALPVHAQFVIFTQRGRCSPYPGKFTSLKPQTKRGRRHSTPQERKFDEGPLGKTVPPNTASLDSKRSATAVILPPPPSALSASKIVGLRRC